MYIQEAIETGKPFKQKGTYPWIIKIYEYGWDDIHMIYSKDENEATEILRLEDILSCNWIIKEKDEVRVCPGCGGTVQFFRKGFDDDVELDPDEGVCFYDYQDIDKNEIFCMKNLKSFKYSGEECTYKMQ